MDQGRRREYKKQNSSNKSHEAFNIESFMLEIDDDNSTNNDLDDFNADEDDAQFHYYVE